MDLDAIAKIAAGEMATKRSFPWKEIGNKYFHGQSTAKLAVRLRQIIFPEITDKDDILTVAAWFHDILNGHEEYHKIHGKKGAELVCEMLANHCTADELGEICDIIAVHDERQIKTDSVLLKLHQDADHLDHFGTSYARRAMNEAAKLDRSMQEAVRQMQVENETNHVHWRSELHFGLSRRIFDEKMAYVFAFADRFEVEANGEIWNEAQLLSDWDGKI